MIGIETTVDARGTVTEGGERRVGVADDLARDIVGT